jgi:hypothetical protein
MRDRTQQHNKKKPTTTTRHRPPDKHNSNKNKMPSSNRNKNASKTLTQALIEEYHGKPEQADFVVLFSAIQQACKQIASAIRTARLYTELHSSVLYHELIIFFLLVH